MGPPRILFLDAYDSFSNNIVSVLTTVLSASVDILPIDAQSLDPKTPAFQNDLKRLLSHYDAVVCGPGPGSPAQASDVGLIKHMWLQPADELVPVLGICLGFQSLVLSCGGIVKKLRTGLHGMIRDIDHAGKNTEASSQPGNIFNNVPPFKATLYHSLHADIGQSAISEAEWESSKFLATSQVPEVVPQAWTYQDWDGRTERILMAVRHRSKPFWGLQYHPESICTEDAGHQVIANWLEESLRWNHATGRVVNRETPLLPGITTLPFIRHSPTLNDDITSGRNSGCWVDSESRLALWGLGCDHHYRELELPPHIEVPDLVELLQCGRRDFIVLDSASAKNAQKIGSDVRGRYSIIALDVDDALHLEYRTGQRHATARQGQGPFQVRERVKLEQGRTMWQLLGDFWSKRQMTPGGEGEPDILPFRGGFMGYVTYEMGLEGIKVELLKERTHERPDLCFAWVTRSIVVDHLTDTLYIQCLSPDKTSSESWIGGVVNQLVASMSRPPPSHLPYDYDDDYYYGEEMQLQSQQMTPPPTPTKGPTRTIIQEPDATSYEDKVRRCQEFIASGDSYELCLTDQTRITKPKLLHRPSPSSQSESSTATSWSLFRTLRSRQPAPFGSYLRLGGATLVSSSPERFVQFSIKTGGSSEEKEDVAAEEGRKVTVTPSSSSSSSSNNNNDDDQQQQFKKFLHCSMRPMKGTVRKKTTSSSPSSSSNNNNNNNNNNQPSPQEASTLQEASAILHIPKEEAENLMIVDLVRHDLHSVCGAGRVTVPHLLKVEEYASVFQMISVVEGRIPLSLPSSSSSSFPTPCSGLDILAATLPPGSMTGAPKKRSCEILQGIETGKGEGGGGGGGGGERSLYSGVVGYMDVTGKGDWSVTIRSMFRWDDEEGDGDGEEGGEGEMEVWHIGAGGAVTALSTPGGETDEMFTKLRGPLGVFLGSE